MRKGFWNAWISALGIFLCACTADYGTFGTSDYFEMGMVHFEEEAQTPSVYPLERRIVVKTVAPDSAGNFDSLTVSQVDVSHFATLRLVVSAVPEFPRDSAAWDSLSASVALAKGKLLPGEKVPLPENGIFYVAVVSESGKCAVWQISVSVPGLSSSSRGQSSSSERPSSSATQISSSSSGAVSSSGTASEGASSASGVPSDSPRIVSVSIGEGNVPGTVSADGSVFFEMDYAVDLDLRSLKVQSLSLSDGAFADGFSAGESYDFAAGLSVEVSDSLGNSKTYVLTAGYQYPNSDFNAWTEDDFGNRNDVEYWDNGNNDAIAATKTLTSSDDGETVVKMESQNAKILGIGRFASGNMFTGYFNPKEVSTIKLMNYDDGNELIDFGRPFYGRPKFVEFDVKYEGSGDSCDLYVLLENRSATENEGKNQMRSSSDVNTLVASAWYRASTVESTEDPDVVSIVDAEREGFKTIRLRFRYGTPLEGSPIHQSSVFSESLQNSTGIDNHLVSTDAPESFNVTHIRVVMASSALGNLYEGTVGATLYCDAMRLIY